MPRNRQLTESRIREAAIALLQERGFEDWGVNAIARQAGVDKVLIYRYFDSVEGLLETIVQETAFWPDPDSLPDHSAEAYLDATANAILGHSYSLALLAHPLARNPVSSIKRKFSSDLNAWMEGFLSRTSGSLSPGMLERVPALVHYQISTGQQNLSAHEIWLQVSPPLEWGPTSQVADYDELPTELL